MIPVVLRALVGLAACAPIVACGSGSSGESTAAFAGKWTCTTTLTDSLVGSYTFTATWTIADLGNSQISVHEDDLECPPVTLKVSGNTAALVPGQVCSTSTGAGATYTSWQATSDGKTLTMDEKDIGNAGIPGERQSSCHR
jgi:hypothetical protein